MEPPHIRDGSPVLMLREWLALEFLIRPFVCGWPVAGDFLGVFCCRRDTSACLAKTREKLRGVS